MMHLCESYLSGAPHAYFGAPGVHGAPWSAFGAPWSAFGAPWSASRTPVEERCSTRWGQTRNRSGIYVVYGKPISRKIAHLQFVFFSLVGFFHVIIINQSMSAFRCEACDRLRRVAVVVLFKVFWENFQKVSQNAVETRCTATIKIR